MMRTMKIDANLLTLAVLAALFPISIAASTYAMVNKMVASPAIIPAPECVYEINAAVDPMLATFLQTHGFRFGNSYRFHTIRLGHWIQEGPPAPLRRLSVALSASGRTCEFITTESRRK